MAIAMLFDFVLCLLGLGDAKALSQQLLAAFYGAYGALFALVAGRSKSTATTSQFPVSRSRPAKIHSSKSQSNGRRKKEGNVSGGGQAAKGGGGGRA